MMLSRKARLSLANRISAQRVILTSFGVDFLDVVLNLTIAFLTGSVVVAAAALQGLADLVAAGLLLLGLKRSERGADEIHPFGYGREIYFWTLMSGLLTAILAGGLSMYFGLTRILEPSPIENLFFAYATLAIGAITNGYSLSLSTRRLLGHHPLRLLWHAFVTSPLVETKTAFILDLKGTATAIVGFLALAVFSASGDLRFDGVGATIIGIIVIALSLSLLAGAKGLLVGRGASPRVEILIREAAASHKEVTDVLAIKTMHIGTEKLLVNLEVHFSHNLTTQEIERMVDDIKEKIRAVVPSAKHIQIELETPRRERRRS